MYLSKDVPLLQAAVELAGREDLAKEVTGKSGAVAKTFLTKKLPAVMAKAINAVVDKTDDMEDFSNSLMEFVKADEFKEFLDSGALESLNDVAKNMRFHFH